MALKLALGLTGQGKDVLRKQGGSQRAKDLHTSTMDAVGYMGGGLSTGARTPEA